MANQKELTFFSVVGCRINNFFLWRLKINMSAPEVTETNLYKQCVLRNINGVKKALEKDLTPNEGRTMKVIGYVKTTVWSNGNPTSEDKEIFKEFESESPLYYACKNGLTEIVETIVNYMRVNTAIGYVMKRNNGSETVKIAPIEIARRNGHFDIVKYLLQDPELDVNASVFERTVPIHVKGNETAFIRNEPVYDKESELRESKKNVEYNLLDTVLESTKELSKMEKTEKVEENLNGNGDLLKTLLNVPNIDNKKYSVSSYEYDKLIVSDPRILINLSKTSIDAENKIKKLKEENKNFVKVLTKSMGDEQKLRQLLISMKEGKDVLKKHDEELETEKKKQEELNEKVILEEEEISSKQLEALTKLREGIEGVKEKPLRKESKEKEKLTKESLGIQRREEELELLNKQQKEYEVELEIDPEELENLESSNKEGGEEITSDTEESEYLDLPSDVGLFGEETEKNVGLNRHQAKVEGNPSGGELKSETKLTTGLESTETQGIGKELMESPLELDTDINLEEEEGELRTTKGPEEQENDESEGEDGDGSTIGAQGLGDLTEEELGEQEAVELENKRKMQEIKEQEILQEEEEKRKMKEEKEKKRKEDEEERKKKEEEEKKRTEEEEEEKRRTQEEEMAKKEEEQKKRKEEEEEERKRKEQTRVQMEKEEKERKQKEEEEVKKKRLEEMELKEKQKQQQIQEDSLKLEEMKRQERKKREIEGKKKTGIAGKIAPKLNNSDLDEVRAIADDLYSLFELVSDGTEDFSIRKVSERARADTIQKIINENGFSNKYYLLFIENFNANVKKSVYQNIDEIAWRPVKEKPVMTLAVRTMIKKWEESKIMKGTVQFEEQKRQEELMQLLAKQKKKQEEIELQEKQKQQKIREGELWLEEIEKEEQEQLSKLSPEELQKKAIAQRKFEEKQKVEKEARDKENREATERNRIMKEKELEQEKKRGEAEVYIDSIQKKLNSIQNRWPWNKQTDLSDFSYHVYLYEGWFSKADIPKVQELFPTLLYHANETSPAKFLICFGPFDLMLESNEFKQIVTKSERLYLVSFFDKPMFKEKGFSEGRDMLGSSQLAAKKIDSTLDKLMNQSWFVFSKSVFLNILKCHCRYLHGPRIDKTIYALPNLRFPAKLSDISDYKNYELVIMVCDRSEYNMISTNNRILQAPHVAWVIDGDMKELPPPTFANLVIQNNELAINGIKEFVNKILAEKLNK